LVHKIPQKPIVTVEGAECGLHIITLLRPLLHKFGELVL